MGTTGQGHVHPCTIENDAIKPFKKISSVHVLESKCFADRFHLRKRISIIFKLLFRHVSYFPSHVQVYTKECHCMVAKTFNYFLNSPASWRIDRAIRSRFEYCIGCRFQTCPLFLWYSERFGMFRCAAKPHFSWQKFRYCI